MFDIFGCYAYLESVIHIYIYIVCELVVGPMCVFDIYVISLKCIWCLRYIYRDREIDPYVSYHLLTCVRFYGSIVHMCAAWKHVASSLVVFDI